MIAYSLVKIDVNRLNHLHLDHIFVSLQIATSKNVIFLKIEEREMSLLVFIR